MIFPLLFLLVPLPGRAEKVAGTVVTSKEWLVRRGAQKEEEFTGDVRYRSGPNLVESDWALYQHASKRWRARGRVFVRKQTADGDVFEAHGDEAVFNEADQSGELKGKRGISFSRAPKEGGADFGQAARASWRGRDLVALEGQVHVWGPRLEAWAERADYDRGRLDLSGDRPVLRKLEGLAPDEPGAWTGAVKADRISASQDDKKMSADGRAVGWIEFPTPAIGTRKK